MTQYNYHDLKDEEHKWALLELIVLDGEQHADMVTNSEGTFDIELTINGEKRDYMIVVDKMIAQIERMVEDRAKEMFNARFGDVSNALYDIEEVIRQKYNVFKDF